MSVFHNSLYSFSADPGKNRIKKQNLSVDPPTGGGYHDSMKFGQRGLDAYKAQSGGNPPARRENEENNTALKALLHEDAQARTLRKAVPPASEGGLLKTGKVPAARKDLPEKGIRQAARFLLLLGTEEAGRVLRNMSDQEIEQITAEIARIRQIGPEEAVAVLEEFGYRANHSAGAAGGVDTARDILHRAFGEERGDRFLHTACPDAVPVPFSFMNDLTLPQMMMVLGEESDEALTVILSFMEPERVSSFLKPLPAERQVNLVKRMARSRKFHPDVISRMETVLQERVHRMDHRDEVEVNGPDRLTEILRHMDSSSEKRILSDLEDGRPDLSRQIREQLHTIDCIFRIRRRDLENLLLETENDRIVMILKGKDERIKEHILNHLSSQRRLLVEEELILARPVPRKEVRRITREFLEYIRRREEEGAFILLGEDEDYLV